MHTVLRLIKLAGNFRRLCAVGFFVVLFAGLSSHAMLESQFLAASADAAWCDVLHHIPHSADCPHNRKPGLPEKDLYSEVAHHEIVTVDLGGPASSIIYRSQEFDPSPAGTITQPHTPPFQPPKQS